MPGETELQLFPVVKMYFIRDFQAAVSTKNRETLGGENCGARLLISHK